MDELYYRISGTEPRISVTIFNYDGEIIDSMLCYTEEDVELFLDMYPEAVEE